MGVTITFKFRRHQKVSTAAMVGSAKILCLCHTADGNYYTLSTDKNTWIDEAVLSSSDLPALPPQRG